jgi:hypothetical protein
MELRVFLPTTIRIDGDEIVHLSTGPPLVWNEQKTEDEFWSFVRSFGGEWLWEHVYTPLGIDAMRWMQSLVEVRYWSLMALTVARFDQILMELAG